jgi:hypothetical protein
MDVNEHERISNITPKHKLKKQGLLYSHSKVFNNEQNSYHETTRSEAVLFTSVVSFLSNTIVCLLHIKVAINLCFSKLLILNVAQILLVSCVSVNVTVEKKL